MNIKKIINDYNTFDIQLMDGDKVLSIYKRGDDPNISCRYKDFRIIDNISFKIPKENEQLYLIFNNLYMNIINGNVYGENINPKRVRERMNLEKAMPYYKEIVQNNTIVVMCDAYPISCPNILRIKKDDNKILLEFEKIIDDYNYKVPFSIAINIRQSGSRIHEFCIPFNNLFKQLQFIEDKEYVKKLSKNC